MNIEIESVDFDFYSPFTGLNIGTDEGLEMATEVIIAIHSEIPDEPLKVSKPYEEFLNNFYLELENYEDLDAEEKDIQVDLINDLRTRFPEKNFYQFIVSKHGFACGPICEEVVYIFEI